MRGGGGGAAAGPAERASGAAAAHACREQRRHGLRASGAAAWRRGLRGCARREWRGLRAAVVNPSSDTMQFFGVCYLHTVPSHSHYTSPLYK
jgi:hypothetical protein